MRVRSSLPAAFAFLLVVGFAAAMPTATYDPDDAGVTPMETEHPEPEETEAPADDPPEGEDPKSAELHGERPENHGRAVSTAAKCPVKGRAHGELVRSVARDKAATVAGATEACEAALAAQETSAGTVSAAKPPKSTGPPGRVTGGKGIPPGHAKPKKKD